MHVLQFAFGRQRFAFVCIAVFIAVLTGCGGGGGSNLPIPGGGSSSGGTGGVSSDFDQGIFRPAATFKDLCAAPRSGAFPDRVGTAVDEKDWLRAWSHDLYLWYDEIADSDPGASLSVPEYFDLMKTFATTPSGAPRDQFHFTIDSEEWRRLSQSGVSAGYGAELALLRNSPPRDILVAFADVSGPAAQIGQWARGTRILEVDGVDAINGSGDAAVAALNAGLFPSSAGESHSFRVSDFDGSNERTVTLVSDDITSDPVPTTMVTTRGASTLGYLLFTDHIAPAEARLVDTIDEFRQRGVDELVLDLRY
ncbi:MAG: peptidase, partial [Pseudomonadota bacterium]